MSAAIQPEPAPLHRKGEPSAHDGVIADLQARGYVGLALHDLRERKAMGLAKYRTVLQPHNGRDSLVDAYQESLDLVAYLRNELNRRQDSELNALYNRALVLLTDLRGLFERRLQVG